MYFKYVFGCTDSAPAAALQRDGSGDQVGLVLERLSVAFPDEDSRDCHTRPDVACWERH